MQMLLFVKNQNQCCFIDMVRKNHYAYLLFMSHVLLYPANITEPCDLKILIYKNASELCCVIVKGAMLNKYTIDLTDNLLLISY